MVQQQYRVRQDCICFFLHAWVTRVTEEVFFLKTYSVKSPSFSDTCGTTWLQKVYIFYIIAVFSGQPLFQFWTICLNMLGQNIVRTFRVFLVKCFLLKILITTCHFMRKTANPPPPTPFLLVRADDPPPPPSPNTTLNLPLEVNIGRWE